MAAINQAAHPFAAAQESLLFSTPAEHMYEEKKWLESMCEIDPRAVDGSEMQAVLIERVDANVMPLVRSQNAFTPYSEHASLEMRTAFSYYMSRFLNAATLFDHGQKTAALTQAACRLYDAAQANGFRMPGLQQLRDAVGSQAVSQPAASRLALV